MQAISILLTLFTVATQSYIAYLQTMAYGSSTFERIFDTASRSSVARVAFFRLGVYNLALSCCGLAGVVIRAGADSQYWQGIGDGTVTSALCIIIAGNLYRLIYMPYKRHLALIPLLPAIGALLSLWVGINFYQ